MGQQVTARTFSREDRQRYRRKVRLSLDVFARMLSEARFHPEQRSFGLEIELNLTDDDGDPALVNAVALEAIADQAFQTELGQFNVEINIPPRLLEGRVFSELEHDARASLNNAEERARTVGAHMMMIGILPTIGPQHLHAESFSSNPRYQLLNEQIFAARGEDLEISIDGVERLSIHADTIAPEAACTSVQLHQQVEPEAFAAHWNAAQAIAGDPGRGGGELAVLLRQGAVARDPHRAVRAGHRHPPGGAEDPGRAAARVVRRALDHVDLRPVRGERAATSRRCCPSARTRIRSRRWSGATSRGWRSCDCTTARSTAGTARSTTSSATSRTCGWRTACCPAGPTVVDIMANAAFYYGLLRVIAEEERPVWSQMSFSAAEENFHAGARGGIDARVYWPGLGEVPAAELVVRRLLPIAREGLERTAIDPADADRLLGIIERRCVTLRNGASWQSEVFHHFYDKGMDRTQALQADDQAVPRAHALQRAGPRLARRMIAAGLVPGRLAALLADPLADQPAQVGDEALLLVGRIRRPDGVEQQPVEVGRAHPVEHQLVDV